MDFAADCFLQVMLSCCSMQAARLSEVTVVAPLTQVFLQPRAKRFTSWWRVRGEVGSTEELLEGFYFQPEGRDRQDPRRTGRWCGRGEREGNWGDPEGGRRLVGKESLLKRRRVPRLPRPANN